MLKLETDPQLKPGDRLYRYVSLEGFIAFIEARRTTLSNPSTWEDPWEAILAKIPTVDADGKPLTPHYSSHQGMYGQCWTLAVESDALWRIYSRGRAGLRLETSVAKFNLAGGIQRAYLGPVSYCDSIQDFLTAVRQRHHFCAEALLKRAAFAHEREVRFLTLRDFLEEFHEVSTRVSVPLDPALFLEGLTIDPRAEDWYVAAITAYCKRAGMTFVPTRSTLYESEPYNKVGLVKQWVPVNDGKGKRPE